MNPIITGCIIGGVFFVIQIIAFVVAYHVTEVIYNRKK